MAPRTARGARKSPPSIDQYRRVITSLHRMSTIVERNASEIEKLRDEQKVQFKRLAQLQAELDAIKKAWQKFQNAQ